MSWTPNRIEVRKGKIRWYWRIVANNGQILSTSQKYFSKYNAERAAIAYGKHAGITEIRVQFRRGLV